MNPPILRNLLLAFVLAGCQAASESDPAQAPPTDVEPTPVETASPETAPALALDGEGFRFVDPSSGSARALPFGTEEEVVVAAIERLRGVPRERGTNSECGAGPLDFASWEDGLTVYASDGRFAGWSVNAVRSDSAEVYTTMAGVGVGSTRAELEDVYAAAVEETTLGTEFNAGDLFGLLSGNGPDAEVTVLWAGVSCNFR